MKSVRTIIFMLLMSVAFTVTAGQPVRWRSSVVVDSDGVGTLTIKALIEPGWHLYGLELPKGGPKPTTFDLSESSGVDFLGSLTPIKAPLTVDDSMFGLQLQWWDANIEFTVPFKLKNADATYKCKISYMACDGNTCMPPATQVLTGKISRKQ